MVQFAHLPSPKPSFKRKAPKRANRASFHSRTRKRIVERDHGLCVKCRARYEEIHHVIFRSQGGLGTYENGVCVCIACHQWAHSGRIGREWFERYRQNYLMEELK